MGLFDSIKFNHKLAKDKSSKGASCIENKKRELKKEIFVVVGTNYQEENIKKIRTLNPEYRKKEYDGFVKIYKYNYMNKPVKLIPEPKNKHDKNAVQVFIAGELVGYISREDNVHVKDILNNHEVKYISSRVTGGDYRIVHPDGTDLAFSDSVKIKISIGYV